MGNTSITINTIVLKKVASLPETVIWRWNGKGYASRLIFVMTCASRSGVGIMESMMLQFILQIGRNPDETTGIDFCGNELSRMRRMSLPLIVPDRI